MAIAKRGKRKKRTFLEDYRLGDRYILRPDKARGRPGVYEGTALDGTQVLIKVWDRSNHAQDEALKEIWRHEVRQLHRIAGHPGGGDCIARLHDAGFDAEGFYLIRCSFTHHDRARQLGWTVFRSVIGPSALTVRGVCLDWWRMQQRNDHAFASESGSGYKCLSRALR